MSNIAVDMREKEFQSFLEKQSIAINAKTFVTDADGTADDKARRWMNSLKATPRMNGEDLAKFIKDEGEFIDKAKTKETGEIVWKESVGEYEKAFRFAVKALHTSSDVLHGTEYGNPVLSRVRKGLLTQPENYPVVVNTQALQAPMNMDMGWMRAYNAVDLRGAIIGKVVDFIGEIKAYELINGQPLKYSNIGYDKAVDVTEKVWGAGAMMDLRMLNTNPAYTINNALIALRTALEVEKSNLAYETLYAAASYSATTNYDTTGTTVVEKDINTINTAAEATLTLLAASKLGIQVTPSSVMYAYFHPSFKARIERAFAGLRGTSGTDPIVAYNIIPVFSYLMPIQPNGANDGFMLVFPGQKNIFATFTEMVTNQETHFDTQSLKVGAIERYNFVVKENKQNRFVKLA